MITIQTTIRAQQITRSLAGDWGATWRAWAGAIAVLLVAVYAAGMWSGEQWHQLLAWAERHHLQGLARMGLPGGPIPMIDVPVQSVMIVHRHAAAVTPRALPAVAPPRVSAIELLAADGMSQRQIARQLGISRHRVKAALSA